MKSININITLLIAAALMLFSCGKPLPTELVVDTPVADQEDFTVEVLSPNPGDINYSNGYDSTGIITTVPKEYFNVLFFNKVIDDHRSMDRNQDAAVAVFFDKTKPVYSPQNHLLGYQSRMVGDVFFNDNKTDIRPLMVGFFDHGMQRDTSLGPMHYLRRNMMGMGMGHGQRSPIADFDEPLNIKIKPANQDNVFQVSILVPSKLDPQFSVSGNKKDKNLVITLNWLNANPENKIDIILGGIKHGRHERLPLIKLTTKDDGELKIPARILKQIPFDQFDALVVSVIRKNEKRLTRSVDDIKTLISAQIIHNLIIDVP